MPGGGSSPSAVFHSGPGAGKRFGNRISGLPEKPGAIDTKELRSRVFLYPARQKAIPYQFYTGKVATARYFAVNVLSGVKVRCEALKVGEKAPLEIVEEAFAF